MSMSVFQIGATNYATVEVEGHLYDVQFFYYGGSSYFVEAVYFLSDEGRLSNLLKYLDSQWLSQCVDYLETLKSMEG